MTIPRPRSRSTIIEHPHYYKIRNHVIHFLVQHAKHGEGADASGSGSRKKEPLVVNFEQQSPVPR